MDTIFQVAKECKSIIDKDIVVDKIKYVHRANNRVDYAGNISGNISSLETALRSLVLISSSKYPQISSNLLNHIELYDKFPVKFLGGIEAIVDCIIALEENNLQQHRIFISHSSKDAQVVKDFTNHILMLGVGIMAEDIFCTSIENMNIRNGEDIRKHIHDNIKGADYTFLMLSDNYKTSEICQNEMGAVWVNDKKIRYYLLPGYTFENIGWLATPNQAELINNAVALDNLKNELVEHFCIQQTPIWSIQREEFLSKHR